MTLCLLNYPLIYTLTKKIMVVCLSVTAGVSGCTFSTYQYPVNTQYNLPFCNSGCEWMHFLHALRGW